MRVFGVVGGSEEPGEALRSRHDQRCQDRGRLDGGELQGNLLLFPDFSLDGAMLFVINKDIFRVTPYYITACGNRKLHFIMRAKYHPKSKENIT